jgi:hypothetical protein
MFFGLAVLIVAMSAPAFGQERFGTFVGTVTDQSGGLLPDATVTIVNKDNNRVQTATADSTGAYAFRQMEPGHYTLSFDHTGFATYRVDDALLLVGQEIRLSAVLQIRTAVQAVEVTEAAPLIDTSGSSTSNNITAEEFLNLPKARSFQSLIQFAPTTNSGALEGGYQINGASGAENSFFVDGVTTNSLIDGRSRENASFEFLQEVQVKTGGMDAEYGGALGGVVNAVTKSGGNQLHGEGHYYYSGNAISAGPIKRLFLYDQFGSGNNPLFVQDHKNQYDTHEVGGSVGGPILKNKVFFFAGISPQFLNRSNLYLFNNGTEPDTLNQSQTAQQVFSKLTAVPVEKLRVNLSWLWSPTRTEGILPAYNGIANSALTTRAGAQPNKTQGWTNPQNNYTGQVDYTLTPTALLSVRGGRFWDNYRNWGIPPVSSITFQTSPAGIAGLPPDIANTGAGFYNTPRTQQTFFDVTTRTYYQVDFSKFIGHALGSHDLKIGVGTTKGVNNVDISYPGAGYVYVYWGLKYKQSGTQNLVGGPYGYYEVDNIGTRGSTGGTMTNLYIQDHWRVLPRLTITLGLRTENEHIPSFRPDIRKDAFSFAFTDKLAPRLGAAWDVLGNGKLKVFGSYGRLFQSVPYETSRGSFGADFWTVYYRSLDTVNALSLSGNNMPGTNLWPSGAYRDRRVPNFNSVAPGIKPMSSDAYNAGIEYQLSNSMVLGASYIGNHLVRTIEDMGVLVDGNEVYQYVNPGEGIAKTYLSSSATPNNFATPKPVRNYDALQLTLTRRLYKGFSGQASYVYSRLYGNYAGMANSDEVTLPTSGVSSTTTQQSGGSIARPGTTASRAYDLDETLFDAKGNILYGRLGTDRPHMLKLYGNYNHAWGGKKGQSEIGAFFRLQSGEPISTAVQTVNTIQVYVNGRGDLGRNPTFNQTDLMIAHEFKLAEAKTLRLEFNAVNLFNQKTNLFTFNQVNRGANTSNDPTAGIDLSNTNLFQGFDYKSMLNALVAKGVSAYDPRFGMPAYWNAGFSGRVGVKFMF